MNRNAYTPITADPVLLRLNSCRDWGTLHQRIRKAFGFPDYYGENWDAMWDCLTDVFLQPQGCPSCCYALIACAVEGQHTFFTGYCTFSSYRRGSAC